LWIQTVIWTSIIGSFLTLFGVYLGFAQWGRGKNGRLSPYRGMFYWHQITGVLLGIVALASLRADLSRWTPGASSKAAPSRVNAKGFKVWHRAGKR
jgi:drug/metabolite transporter (DMT)-like permease